MRPTSRSLIALSLVTLLSSCASQSAPGTAAGAAPMRDRSVLTREEIMRSEYQTAFDAVLALRRNWIVERPQDRVRETTPVVVYLDEMRLGGIEELRTIVVGRIARINYFDGITAYGRWGLGHDRGVVQVISMVSPPRTTP